MPTIKVAVLNYTGDRANWGCQATSVELVQELRKIFLEQGMPEIDFVLVPLLPKKRIVDRLVNNLFRRSIAQWLSTNENSPLQRKLLYFVTWLLYRKYLPEIRGCRYVFFQAEGTMKGTAKAFFGGLRLLLLPYVIRVVMGKPVLSLNQTIWSIEPTFAAILRNCYNAFGMVAVREPASYHHARDLGIEDVTLIPDSAFLTTASDKSPAELLQPAPAREYFCVTGSMIIHRRQTREYLNVIRQAALENDLDIVLICSATADVAFLTEAKSQLSDLNVVIAPRHIGYRDVASIIAGSKFLIGGRYHMLIVSAAMHVPFVLLPSGTHKTQGLVDLLSYPLPVRQFDDVAGMQEDIRRVLSERDTLSQHLKEKMEEVKSLKVQGEETIKRSLRAVEQPAS